MRFWLLFVYVWGCLVMTGVMADKKSKLPTIDKVVRVATWPLLVETWAIIHAADEIVKP